MNWQKTRLAQLPNRYQVPDIFQYPTQLDSVFENP